MNTKILILIFAASIAPAALSAEGPWLGLTLPGPLSTADRAVIATGNFAPATPRYPKPKDPKGYLGGEHLMSDVHRIVGFSIESREAGEPLWGRISGTPSELKTVEWVASRFKAAGIENAHVEKFDIDSPLWFPKSWELRVLGGAAMGGGADLLLKSAFPQPNGQSLPTPVSGPLVFVGRGTAAELANVEVRGKIAVVHVVLNDSLFDARERGVADAVVKLGALGAINVIDSPGNLYYFDSRYGCGKSPCFAVGGEDGAFLENLMGEAALAHQGPVQVRLSLESELREHLSAANAIAVIPGKSDRIILIGAHADGWFDGANDNADGLATLIAEAQFFAQRHAKPEHTLIFMASAGHHNAGNGASAYIKQHPETIEHLSLMINLEHLAQLSTIPSSPVRVTVGFPGLPVATTTETPKQIGISTESAYLRGLFARASREYGLVTVSTDSRAVPGDAGPWLRIKKPAVQLISASTFYHSTGDVEALISKSGLERAAAFWADFIATVDQASDDRLR